ncbi:MAG: bifunctional (p)ppGpp synthetase/guanosine-3',5'-bis(diphosphate) 3'-pyrophosphohydrolase [Acutalibacteraceae bacterium]|nr:bifunctional (p)ppGpp synthetase/guanosine-3',5'-bis(diphosphate) 3'-pyrophosphohydrolase [Acutalibacteraceae bacterium]
MDSVYEKDYNEFYEYLVAQNIEFDYEKIKKAFEFCVKVHKGQLRQSKEEYYIHPVSVAKIVAQLGLDSEAVCAALLHDAVEDTETSVEDVSKLFGSEVALLVDGVTKIGRLSFISKEEQQAESIRKMLIAMGKDIRVIIIKLADRLHNMRTIDYMPSQKQRDKALETLEVYAPIAHRLGIRPIKEELEDISIAHLDPVAYKEIETLLKGNNQHSSQMLETVKDKINERLKTEMPDVKTEFQSRVKSINGIYRKMFVQGKSFEEIYDVYAVRIITDTVANCYNILGIMHDLFRPIPNRFKDYISTPKPNMYQSLHTTVIGRERVPFEIQIRTFEMHETAEYGIAAHWKYKAGIHASDAGMESQLAWIRQILEAQNDSGDASEIIRSIKVDLAQDDVFAVTPKGDVINLPVGATVVDFAFAIHSAVGIKMVGAKVDGRIVPINHVIKTGEIIEILTTNQAGHGPSRDWINIAVTNQAKSKIRSWFKKEKRAENIESGKSELEKEFKRNSISFDDNEQYESFLLDIAKRQHLDSVDELYAAIGYGGVILARILPNIKENFNRISKQNKVTVSPEIIPHRHSKASDGVIVEGIDNCLIKFSKCCAPLPGDDIIGFITRGHGVSIHKRDCINVPVNIEEASEPERWITAYWADNYHNSFLASIQITAIDRQGLILDISQALVNMRVALHGINARPTKNGNSVTFITVSTEGVEHLKNIITRLEKIHGVFHVERLNQ